VGKGKIIALNNIRILLWCLLLGIAGMIGCSSPKSQTDNPGNSNVLTNGDFETGQLSPWAPYLSVRPSISSDRVRSGHFSLREGFGKGSVYQDVKGLRPNTEYEISAWVCATPGSTATAQIAAFDAGANVATFSAQISPTQDWQMIKHRITMKSDSMLRIHLFRNDGSGDLIWDDVKINPAQ
jgi:Carbohydrate binding domain